MKFTYPLEIGQKTFVIEDEAASMQELFEKVAPMQAMEIAAQGKPDVYLSFRTTRDGHKYYALVCPPEHTEFALGMSQKRPGELFPGKVIKSGNTKKTVREWTRIQHGDAPNHDDDEAEREEVGTNPVTEPTPPGSAGQSTSQPPTANVLPIQNRPLTEEQIVKAAQAIVAAGGVTRTVVGYQVQVNPKTKFFVTKDGEGNVVCDCERFTAGQKCPHLRAVRLWTAQPAKPDGRSELKLLTTDLLEVGYEPDQIDAMIARVCDGVFAIEDLNSAQAAKAIRSLTQKLEESKLRARVSA